MRNLLGTCTLFVTATVFAQSPAGSTSPTILVAPPASANCPIGLAAQHTRDGAVVNVRNGATPGKVGYDLTLSPQPHAAKLRITKATVTLHGLRGGHLQPAAGKGANDATNANDATEHITLSPWVGKDGSFHSTVYTGELTAVQWIELNELTYADGTAWHESPTATCRVTPNGLMLVTASAN